MVYEVEGSAGGYGDGRISSGIGGQGWWCGGNMGTGACVVSGGWGEVGVGTTWGHN